MSKRDWQTYLIKHHFKEREEEPWPVLDTSTVDAHRSRKLDGWETQIMRLPVPVIANASELVSIGEWQFFGTKVRLYPPFPIDRRGEVSGTFQDCWLPEGKGKVDKFVRLPPDAARGLTTEQMPTQGARYCQGLRIDAQGPAQLHKIVQVLLEQMCQHTHQWWLRGRADPFRGIRRLGCDIDEDFAFHELLRHNGALDLASPWHAVIETQSLIGIELPLTEQIWLRCCNDAAAGMRGDIGILSFHDALSYYMEGDEVLCIMSMTICVEVLGNKRRMLLGKKPTGFGELLRTSDLIGPDARPLLQNLFIDRGHVAHGRRPHVVSRGDYDGLFAYLEAVRTVLSAYIAKMGPEDWPRASQLEVGRGKA